jgi:hypothetical protein
MRVTLTVLLIAVLGTARAQFLYVPIEATGKTETKEESVVEAPEPVITSIEVLDLYTGWKGTEVPVGRKGFYIVREIYQDHNVFTRKVVSP